MCFPERLPVPQNTQDVCYRDVFGVSHVPPRSRFPECCLRNTGHRHSRVACWSAGQPSGNDCSAGNTKAQKYGAVRNALE